MLRTVLSLAGVLSLGATLLACSSSGGTGGGTVTGTVASTTFTVQSSIGVVTSARSSVCISGPDGGGGCTEGKPTGTAIVVLTNEPSVTCSEIISAIAGQGENLGSADALLLAVSNQNGALSPGTFTIIPEVTISTGGGPTTTPANPGPLQATAEFGTTTATCATGVSLTATSGTVTLTTVNANEVVGTYSVTFGKSGTFSGTFDVGTCSIPDGATNGSGSSRDAGKPACMP